MNRRRRLVPRATATKTRPARHAEGALVLGFSWSACPLKSPPANGPVTTSSELMYKTCNDCDFYTQDTSQQACPNCGNLLQFTMLPPRSGRHGRRSGPGAGGTLTRCACRTRSR